LKMLTTEICISQDGRLYRINKLPKNSLFLVYEEFKDSFDSVISRMIEREKIAMSGRTLAGSSLNTATASQLSEGDSRDNG
jgi:hypothetical protein